MTDDDLPFVPTSGLQIRYAAIDEKIDRCAAHYPGIYTRCASDAEFVTNYWSNAEPNRIGLCREHAAQFADCDCGGDHLDRQFHGEQCTDDIDDLGDDGRSRPDCEDRDFEDYISQS